MSKTIYNYTVTLKHFDEDVVRLVPSTSVLLAIKEFKRKMFVDDFWKKENYRIGAEINIHYREKRPEFIWPY